jgi:tetratricopeptide (TPR) repeat protein
METAQTSEPQVIGHRFVLLQELGKGGMGVVHRAYDKLTGEEVALKQVITDPMSVASAYDTPSNDELMQALTHEFTALATLRHPNIISVLDYGFDEGGLPYFAMELLQHPKTLLEAAENTSLATRIDLLVQMLQALNYLHRYGILHRDIKPQNVQVVGGRVKVLDFGLAILKEKTDGTASSGTLAYMAPEVIMGSAASEASDLYAVGVMAFELFAGQHPFGNLNSGRLITDILSRVPDATLLDVNEELVQIVSRLLEKDPINRYHDAYEVLQVLKEATGLAFDLETDDTRESFLQAARFVGRESEIAPLAKELENTLSGKGNAYLVSGESGVGKSRLLDELRILALVKGLRVFRGQEVREGGNPYEPWRDILRRMCLYVSLTNIQASILKTLIPDLPNLLQRPVPDAVTLDAGAAQDRLFVTIEDMFRRNTRPVLVILEDLQWADSATLLLLSRLHRMTTVQPLFIVGSYRLDERPKLADNLPISNHLKLARFDETRIEELAVSMLGNMGRNPRLLKLLKEESGGNPYFLVEVVRALAEMSGGLTGIASMTFPKKIFPGGIQDILTRRLDRVPADTLPILQLAAVLGRQVEEVILRHAYPDVDFEFWFSSIGSLAILEVAYGHWRFTQSKLRDAIIERLSPQELIAFHLQAAQTIEAIYPNGDGHFSQLALHWEIAQDLPRASYWYEKAAHEAVASYAPELAIEYFQKALAYLPQDENTANRQIAIYGGLGRMLRWQTRFDEATDIFGKLGQLGEQEKHPEAQVQAWIGLYEVNERRGERKTALANAEQAEVVARSMGASGESLLAEALGCKAYIAYRLRQYDLAMSVGQETLALSQRLDIKAEIARSQSVMGIVSAMTQRYDDAASYMMNALEIAWQVGDRRDIGIRMSNLAEVEKLRGKYDNVAQFFERARVIFNEIGYLDYEIATLTNLGSIHLILGHYDQAEQHLQNALQLNTDDNWWGLSETYRCLAEAQLHHGMISDAKKTATLSLSQGKKAEVGEYIGRAWRVLGMTHSQDNTAFSIDGNTYLPVACFEESIAVFKAEQNDIEQAHTLREWAYYEEEHGNHDRAVALWQEAFATYSRHHFQYDTMKLLQKPLM